MPKSTPNAIAPIGPTSGRSRSPRSGSLCPECALPLSNLVPGARNPNTSTWSAAGGTPRTLPSRPAGWSSRPLSRDSAFRRRHAGQGLSASLCSAPSGGVHQLQLLHRRREGRPGDLLADHPVAVVEHLPVVVGMAEDCEGDDRPGEFELADRGARRRVNGHVGDLPAQVFQQGDGLPVIRTVGELDRQQDAASTDSR